MVTVILSLLFVHSRFSKWIVRGGFQGPHLPAEENIWGDCIPAADFSGGVQGNPGANSCVIGRTGSGHWGGTRLERRQLWRGRGRWWCSDMRYSGIYLKTLDIINQGETPVQPRFVHTATTSTEQQGYIYRSSRWNRITPSRPPPWCDSVETTTDLRDSLQLLPFISRSSLSANVTSQLISA